VQLLTATGQTMQPALLLALLLWDVPAPATIPELGAVHDLARLTPDSAPS
jgi:hypothetical protein